MKALFPIGRKGEVRSSYCGVVLLAFGVVAAAGPVAHASDCNRNGLPDECDLHCGLPGCNLPGCGQSHDDNANLVPDECDCDFWVAACTPQGGESGTELDPFCTIQNGINAATDGDVVCVNQGTYAEVVEINDRITLKATGSRHDTTIFSSTSLSAVTISNTGSGSGAVVVQGFTIRSFRGTGIYIASPGSNVVVEDNVIWGSGCHGIHIYKTSMSIVGTTIVWNGSNCWEYIDGGGLYVVNDDADGFMTVDILDCIIEGNQAAGAGGGVYVFSQPGSTTVHMWNCILENNASQGSNGGGLYITGNLARTSLSDVNVFAELQNCLIACNQADYAGGGLFVGADASVHVVNTTMANNVAQHGGGIRVGGAASVEVKNSILWGDDPEEIDKDTQGTVAVQYSDVDVGQGQLPWPGNGNINEDPSFVSPGDPGDFRLQDSSLASDAGNNDLVLGDYFDLDNDGWGDEYPLYEETPVDLGWNNRFLDNPNMPDSGYGTPRIVDMGAYERQCSIATAAQPERLALPNWDPPNPISQKIRYLSFSAGDAGRTQAIRVTFANVPVPYTAWEGTELWVQQPKRYCENAAQKAATGLPPSYGCGASGGITPAWFWAADLGCDPFWADWTTFGVVHVWSEGIIPTKHSPLPVDAAQYDIQVIDEACLPIEEGDFSTALTLTQSRWGDLVSNCTTNPCGPPDNSVGIVDVTAALDKWKNLPGNVQKARADIEGAPSGDARIPNQAVDITDVTRCSEAFRLGYVYPPPGFPPPRDPPDCD